MSEALSFPRASHRSRSGDLATSAERVFAGTYITEVEVRERALAWVPEVMRFVAASQSEAYDEPNAVEAENGATDEHQQPSELARLISS